MPPPERLRELLWELGTRFPPGLVHDHLLFVLVQPRLGFLEWFVREDSLARLRETRGAAVDGARMILRVYDVTDVLFDGFNAHSVQDVTISGPRGAYYFRADKVERNLIAEVGLLLASGEFCAFARSAAVFFDRERPTHYVDAGGLFVGRRGTPIFAVDSVLDAPVYERLVSELGMDAEEPLSLAMALVRLNEEMGARLLPLIDAVGQRCRSFGGDSQFFTNDPREMRALEGAPLLRVVDALGEQLFERVLAAQRGQPFHVVHCHDWYSAGVGIETLRALRIPFVLTLHSIERVRAGGFLQGALSLEIARREREAAALASIVIVPHAAAQHDVASEYGVAPQKIWVISHESPERPPTPPAPGEVKRSLQLHPDWPVLLFAGEVGHAAGADILLDAVLTVARRSPEPQFVFAGEGYLRGSLEARAWHEGVAHRVRFLGDVPAGRFRELIGAADAVVIPARAPQDPGLCQMAISLGKPVLATHQANLGCILHGQNGLVTFDNPGSIVWGISELLANPLASRTLRLAALRRSALSTTLDRVVVDHYLCYAKARRSARE